ncbi:SH3 domain-containing protein [bacterium]|nr:MAG: SH3 domain-containing protein [bacterium]
MKKSVLVGLMLLTSICLFAGTQNNYDLKIKVRVANVRSEPDLNAQVIGQVKMGDLFEALNKIGSFIEITITDKTGTAVTGYIHSGVVEVISGEETKEETKRAVHEEQEPVPAVKENVPLRDNPKEAAPAVEPSVPQNSNVRLGIRLTGGLAYLVGGDAYSNRKSYDAYWRDRAQQPGSGTSIEGGTESINWGMNWEGDVVYYLNPRLGIGIGTGFIRASEEKGQSRIVIRWPGEMRTVDRGNMFSAVPIKLGVFYSLLQGRKFNLFLNAGVGYYLARWEESEDYIAESQGNSFWKKLETKMHAGGIGFHGGLGLEYRLSRNIALVMEGFGRYARFGGFEGEYTEKYSGGTDVTEKGKLYYYEWSNNNKDYSWIELLDRDPSQINFSSPIKNARDAIIDFSGFSLRAGIKISL